MAPNSDHIAARVEVLGSRMPILVVAPFRFGDSIGADVHDSFTGIRYRCTAVRTALGRAVLTYLSVEVEHGQTFEDVDQLDPQLLALFAVEVEGGVLGGEPVARELPNRLARFTRGGVDPFEWFERPNDRATPSPQWVARVVTEVRSIPGLPWRETVAKLGGVSVSTVDRWVDRAIAAGLLERQKPGRPVRNSKGTPHV